MGALYVIEVKQEKNICKKLRSVREEANSYISPLSDFENTHNGFPVSGRHDTNDKGHELLSRPMTYQLVSVTTSVTRQSSKVLHLEMGE